MGQVMIPSHVRGASTPPLIQATIGAAFDAAIARDPDGLALIARHQDIRWTWTEVSARVDAVARAPLARGLPPGDRLGSWAPHGAEWAVVAEAQEGFARLSQVPAPKRGEVIRDLGSILREYKEPLGELVALELGKILVEGLGEVQERIDICDVAVGLSRQL